MDERRATVGSVGCERADPRKIAAVGVEGDLICRFERANEVGDRILRKNESAVHVIARIEQNKYVCAVHELGKGLGEPRSMIFGSFQCRTGHVLSEFIETASGSIAFGKCRNLFHDAILNDGKIAGIKTGNYITGLKPSDFAIVEDGIVEKTATFAEGNGPARRLNELGQDMPGPALEGAENHAADGSPETLAELVNGANVFVLFDTSDYMYRGFVFAQDAISDFIRSLETADKIAFYSYSRDLSRVSSLTSDRTQLLRAVRSTVAGDQAALYNALLLTLKDAAHNTGRKVVVVFSNGPENSSVVPPEDVAEFAQSAGVSIYMISTREARLEPVSTAVFDRMTAATGGKAYFAKNW